MEFNMAEKKYKSKKSKKRGPFRWLLTSLIVLLVGGIFGYAYITFFRQTIQIVGPSMEDTYNDGDTVWINKLKFKTKGVNRYDVIAYKKLDSEEYYDVKRVYGLPGETVEIINGELYINDEKLDKVYYGSAILVAGLAGNKITLGKEEYFVLGDNINNSEDSRYGSVSNVNKSEIKGIVGKVVR